jgi:hypothetical protein
VIAWLCGLPYDGRMLSGLQSQARCAEREIDKCKILFLAAKPQGTTPLALDKEIREAHVANAASWLGDNWHKLLSLVGLTL